ncbi:MAG: glycosyltransferase family 39 protein [Planctomycetes bacterium]|nr:glycosyltransferase family 39 protein [Planctomycetota bacterium]
MRQPARPLLLLLIAAALVHAGVLAAAYWRTGSFTAFAFQSLDAGEYYRIARNVAEHGAYSQSTAAPFLPDTWRTPGYPLSLAPLIVLFGDAPVVLVFAQQLLAVADVLLVYLVARRHMSVLRAVIAAVCFLLEPYRLFYSLWLLSTTLQLTVLLLAWLAWDAAVRERLMGWCVLLGLAAAWLVLIWPGAVLILLALAIGLGALRWVRRRPGETGRAGRGARHLVLAFLAASAFGLAPWLWRNYDVAGHLALSDQSGVVLAYFKAAEVMLWRQGRTADRYLELSTDPARVEHPHAVWEMIDRDLQRRLPDLPEANRARLTWRNLAQGNRTGLDSFRISQALRGVGSTILLEAPASALVCYAQRFVENLTFPINLAVAPPAGVPERRARYALQGIPYVLLGAAVLWRLGRPRGLRFGNVYFALAAALALMATIAPQVDPRFRVPLIPLLLVVALLPRKPTVGSGPA